MFNRLMQAIDMCGGVYVDGVPDSIDHMWVHCQFPEYEHILKFHSILKILDIGQLILVNKKGCTVLIKDS